MEMEEIPQFEKSLYIKQPNYRSVLGRGQDYKQVLAPASATPFGM
jgi:hypothetical protein